MIQTFKLLPLFWLTCSFLAKINIFLTILSYTLSYTFCILYYTILIFILYFNPILYPILFLILYYIGYLLILYPILFSHPICKPKVKSSPVKSSKVKPSLTWPLGCAYYFTSEKFIVPTHMKPEYPFYTQNKILQA